ncbi:MAG: flavin reductase family protein [Verrucomicrobiales bacterium]|nr:flavin reductase family protein [Verrucomicrobiales bacterium]
MKQKKTDPIVHQILREIPYGLYVVGLRGRNDGDFNALVVSWLTQCSFDPPLIMIALRKGTRSYELIEPGAVFSVNLIDQSDRQLAREMVKPSRRVGDKIGRVGHVQGKTGAPILREAFGYVECEVREITEPGDHALVIGEVIRAGKQEEGHQLMCSDLRWHYAG